MPETTTRSYWTVRGALKLLAAKSIAQKYTTLAKPLVRTEAEVEKCIADLKRLRDLYSAEIEGHVHDLEAANTVIHPTLVGVENPTALQKAADKVRRMLEPQDLEVRAEAKRLREMIPLWISKLLAMCQELEQSIWEFQAELRRLRKAARHIRIAEEANVVFVF